MNSLKSKLAAFIKKLFNSLSLPARLSWIKPKNKAVENFNLQTYKTAQEQINLDKKLVFSLSKSRFPNFGQLKHIGEYLSPAEKWLLRISISAIVFSFVFLGIHFYFSHLEFTPIQGGVYSEALIGNPKYINPLYNKANDVDQDISRLIYSALFRRDSQGKLAKDLISNYKISKDGKNYQFSLKPNLKWSDGSPLTVDDIIFTFQAIQDVRYKSPLYYSFQGVKIKKDDDSHFSFILSEPYAAFLELLTFGIIPSNLWSQIPPDSALLAELNLRPIGSGPYKFKKLIKDKTGLIREYDLDINDNYYGQKPLVKINYKFYPNFTEAITGLNENVVDGLAYLPTELKKDIITPKTYNFYRLNLPELTALFFNQKKNKNLSEKSVRQAMAQAIDRTDIINNFLGGDAYVVNSPILPNNFAYNKKVKKYNYNPEESMKLLDAAGWKLATVTAENIIESKKAATSTDKKVRSQAEEYLSVNIGHWRKKDGKFLRVKITTIDRGENQKILEDIKNYWEKIGIKTEVEVVPASRVHSEIIAPRNFDILFYSQVIGADPDLYAFWHSSQTGPSGYNITGYSNKEADKLLEEARLTANQKQRADKYKKFQEILTNDLPAFFMYSPIYIYVQSKKLHNFNATNIVSPSDRLANATEWYIKTGKKLKW